MEQRKTESVNQFAGLVEQRFKRLRALYLGRYDHNQLKESFSGNAPAFKRFNEVSLYEGRGRI